MKTRIPFLLLLLAPFWSVGQVKIKIKSGCNFADAPKETEVYASEPTPKIQQLVDDILSATSQNERNFELLQANVPNAVATTENGRRRILYSEEFLKSRTKNGVLAVLAHEVGHHVLGHDLEGKDPEKRKQNELAADDYAARVLNTLCVPLDSVTVGLAGLPPGHTATHPPVSARREIMKKGWKTQDKHWQDAGGGPCAARIVQLNLGQGKQYNRAQNTRAKVDGEKMVITYDALFDTDFKDVKPYFGVKKGVNIIPTHFKWMDDPGQEFKQGMSKRLIWEYEKDGFSKEQVDRPDWLNVFVFRKKELPKPVPASGWAKGVGLIAGACAATGASLYFNKKWKPDYEVYKTHLNPNDPVFGARGRADFYDGAQKKYAVAQGLAWGSAALTVWATAVLTKKIKQHNRHKNFRVDLY